MAIELRKIIEVNASPKAIWTVMIDLQRWPDWTPSISSIEYLDPAPLQRGSRVRILQPKLPPTVWTITSWEPGKSFAWESRRLGVITRADHLIVTKDGGAMVELTVEFGGLLGGLAGRIASKLTNAYMTLEAEGLKNRCEQGRVSAGFGGGR